MDRDLRNRLVDSFRSGAREVYPAQLQRRQAAALNAFEETGDLQPDVFSRSLPPYIVSWFLAGANSTGVNKSTEIEMPSAASIRGLRLRAKTAPGGTECTVFLRVNGAAVASATINTGQTSGRSVGMDIAVDPGAVLTIDVTAAGGSNISVICEYVPKRV